MKKQGKAAEPRWLLLIHQIPARPNYLRVKVWRQLQRLGAVALKDAVYALPSTEQAREDLEWVVREIVAGGGDASLVEARLVDGLDDEQVKELFRRARDADYDQVAAEARALAARLPRRGGPAEPLRAELVAQLLRLQKRVREIAAIDHFQARSREAVDGLVGSLEARLAPPEAALPADRAPARRPQRATWVTRTGVHVDRIASAWLIRRFLDPEARFKFVVAKEHRPKAGELRFDMFDGEFTHQGELCTFEVLLQRFELAEAALRPIAELVHDIDLKDERYGRPETAGLAQVIHAICAAHPSDEARLQRGSALFDDLYQLFKQRRPAQAKTQR
jgi:hypothetical protein